MKILLVEDDRVLQQTLAIGLRAEKHEVLVAADGRTAKAALREDDPDLVVLDLGLPDLPGMEVLAWLRQWSQLPVIVLSARADSSDKVDALDAGADDYVTKPFGFEELLARIRAARRRSGADLGPVVAGELVVDLGHRRVTRAGKHVHLTPKEWAAPRRAGASRRTSCEPAGPAAPSLGPGLRSRRQLPAHVLRHAAQEARGQPGRSAPPHHRAWAGLQIREGACRQTQDLGATVGELPLPVPRHPPPDHVLERQRGPPRQHHAGDVQRKLKSAAQDFLTQSER